MKHDVRFSIPDREQRNEEGVCVWDVRVKEFFNGREYV
jgi:hypothetical protein